MNNHFAGISTPDSLRFSGGLKRSPKSVTKCYTGISGLIIGVWKM